MATRRYLANTAPSYTPSTVAGGDWNDIAVNVWRKIGDKAGANATIARAETSTSATYDIAMVTGVADIVTPGTILAGDTIDIRMGRLASATSSFQLACFAWITAGDTSSLRGQLIPHYVSGVNWTTAAAFTGFTLTVGANVAVQAGDHIMFEMGARAVNTVSTSRTATLYYGGTGPDSVGSPPTDTPPTSVGWFDFTGAIEDRITAPAARGGDFFPFLA